MTASLEAVMKQNTGFYQSNFGINKQIIAEKAASPRKEGKTLLWFCQPSGTHCFWECNVLIKDTSPDNIWHFYKEQTRDPTKVVCNWIELAKQRDYKRLMIDTAKHSYSDTYLKKYRFLYLMLGLVGKPKSFDRFLFQAASCVHHNAYPELDKIVCPTLVIGGGCDKIVGTASSPELAEKIKNSELFVYKTYGHAAYEEAEDFNDRVFHFFMR